MAACAGNSEIVSWEHGFESLKRSPEVAVGFIVSTGANTALRLASYKLRVGHKDGWNAVILCNPPEGSPQESLSLRSIRADMVSTYVMVPVWLI